MTWLVAQTFPGEIGSICRSMRRTGLEFYNPRLHERRVTAGGRTVICNSQLFPNYLFVNLFANVLTIFLRIAGVVKLFTSVINPEVIAELKLREDENGFVRLRPPRLLGDKVTVRRGAFATLSGIYDGQLGADRVYVLLTLLGSQRRIELASDCIE